MKTIKKLLFIVGLSAAFVSCSLFEVPVKDVQFETNMNVQVLENSTNVSMMQITAVSKNFSKEGEANLADNADVKDKLDKIKSLNITEVRITAEDFVPIGTKISGFVLSFPDLNITKGDIDGTETKFEDIIVDFTAAELTKIQDAILKNKKIKYKVSGTVSQFPVTFNIKTIYTADIKASLF